PKFENVEGAFRVTLPNIHAQETIVENEKYLPILQLFENKREITRSDVEEILGVGTTHAINMLKEMLQQDLVIKVGGGRQTRYVIK
ncbi:MAG: AAA family ATPase, partial [Anaerovoracaceae bacterium]